MVRKLRSACQQQFQNVELEKTEADEPNEGAAAEDNGLVAARPDSITVAVQVANNNEGAHLLNENLSQADSAKTDDTEILGIEMPDKSVPDDVMPIASDKAKNFHSLDKGMTKSPKKAESRDEPDQNHVVTESAEATKTMGELAADDGEKTLLNLKEQSLPVKPEAQVKQLTSQLEESAVERDERTQNMKRGLEGAVMGLEPSAKTIKMVESVDEVDKVKIILEE